MKKLKSNTKNVKEYKANLYEVSLSEVLESGSVSYEEDGKWDGTCLAVGNECMDHLHKVLVKGTEVDPKDVVFVIAEEACDEE